MKTPVWLLRLSYRWRYDMSFWMMMAAFGGTPPPSVLEPNPPTFEEFRKARAEGREIPVSADAMREYRKAVRGR